MGRILTNDVQSVVFVIITLLWWLEFVIFPSPKGQDTSKSVQERQSFRRIMAAILASIGFAIVTVNLELGLWPAAWIPGLRNASVIMYAVGLGFRYGSLISLGKHFSRNVEVAADQELISSGFYRFLRHPLYLGLFLLATAVPLFMGSALGFFVAVILVGAMLNQRMALEERLMEEVMGSRYQAWKAKRFRFIPFIY